MNELLTLYILEKLYNINIKMLSQRETRYRKQKIIGGSLLKNVYDKLKKVISTGSKILNRGSKIKKLVSNQVKTNVKN